ncbi:MAG: hypothetical protein E6I91_04710 [Chloroflexi bacterium]|nr:MAG: hypothetical protein E6I91_04710 [Chloroflexota bacterium]
MKTVKETQTPVDTAGIAPAPHEKRGGIVSRWTVLLGIVAIGLLYFALPDRLTIGPSWLLLTIEAIVIIPLLFIRRSGHPLAPKTIRILALVLLGAVTIGLVGSVSLLILQLPAEKGSSLLRDAALLWGTNILVFALWYWEIDGGGPQKRHLSGHKAADFMFPQQADGNTTGWVAHFADYLFLAFTGATALSPADTYPLTRQAKMLMMTEAMLSMIVIVLLAARAVNIYGQ